MRTILDETIERYACNPKAIPKAVRYAVEVLIGHDRFVCQVAEFYGEFYEELEGVEEHAAPNLDAFIDLLFQHGMEGKSLGSRAE